MKKKTTKFLLSALQIIIDFSILIFILITFILSLMSIEAIIANGTDALETFASANPVIQIGEFIDGFVMAVITIIMALGIRNIIDNINNELYFVPQNLTAIRKILLSATSIFLIQLLNSGLFPLLQIKDANKFFTFQGNGFGTSIAFIITIFLIYLVFKRGLTLQRDADSII